MKIREYKEISENVKVSGVVQEGYQNAMKQIREENGTGKAAVKPFKQKTRNALAKIAVAIGAVTLLSGGTFLSVKAYIGHLEKIRNMEAEEVIELYENIFRYDSKDMSRALSEEEERRFGELYDLYCRDLAEPKGEVAVIASKTEYEGEGIAFSKEDGILNLPAQEMTDEEILQLVVFNLLGRYVDYEAYMEACNPLHYMNALEQMTAPEVDAIYINYSFANTETSFQNRALSFDEMGRRKVLKMLYKNGEKQPENAIPMIQKESEYCGEGIAFCVNNCTFYFPDEELSDEQLLELIDFQIKVDYCRQRIADEIEHGIRKDFPYIEYAERERIITLDYDLNADEEILSQQWLKAYEEVLRAYYRENSTHYENPERYYANVCFIYLNDDEIPEMLFSHGCTDLDYHDNCNLRNYLYTYKDGEAVLLAPGEGTMDDFYGYDKPFSYVEQKGMVYCDYYYIYDFSTYDSETDVIDQVTDSMSRMDVWDLATMTCTSSNANIEMLHAVYHYTEEEYADADFDVAYYVNVSDIIRDENTGYVKEIIGEKVDRLKYEKSEAELWDGEQITTLSVGDYDKIYAEDNLPEALAECYLKKGM